MIGRNLTPLALALSVVTNACDADRITSSNAGLSLEASVSDASVESGESATFTYRLRNDSRLPRTVSVGCGNFVHYIDDEKGANVYPGDRTMFCASILLPPVTLAPGEEIAHSVRLQGDATAPTGAMASLPPGRYTIFVEYRGQMGEARTVIRLRSPRIEFEITP